MFDLIVKDVVASRWFLVIALPIYVVQLVGMSSSPPAFAIITLLFTGAIAFGSIAIEEIQGTEILWCSLPLSRRDVVIARYGTTLLGIVVGLGASWVVGRVAAGAISSDPTPPAALVGPEVYAALFLMLAILAALFLPCYFLLGAGKGLFAFAALSLGLVVTLTLGGSAIASFLGADPLADTQQFDAATVEGWITRWSGVGSVVLILLALLATVASAAISARFYRTRDC